MKKSLLLCALACILLAAACKKTEPTPETPVANGSFELMQQKIFTPSCNTTNCHAATSDRTYSQHKIVLAGDIYSRLINGTVANNQAMTANLKQIVPNDTAKSFLYQKLIFDRSQHRYGSGMPLGADPLTPNQIKFVVQWIMAGAPRTGDVADKTLLN
jgi:hypothetical protein